MLPSCYKHNKMIPILDLLYCECASMIDKPPERDRYGRSTRKHEPLYNNLIVQKNEKRNTGDFFNPS